MNPPSGTVTFLFTDIEGSTRVWEEQPEAMRSALARHDTLLRQAIEQREGYVFKTVGDAFCAAFATASNAVATALDIQLALQAEDWGEVGALRVRMGLHTGEAEERDEDYFGQAVNRVARLQGVGYGQQTLLSHTTYELVRDNLPPLTSILDLGSHRLKDLQRPEHVFQLLHPALPFEFPPLRSLDNPTLPNNLPQQLTSFIGREKEMREVNALLSNTRLLTLVGIGGTGKTRLSLQVAADLLDGNGDGVWLVEFAPVSDSALIPQTVASVLGVSEQPDKTITQTLIDDLQSRRLLLIFDNCEHVLDACARLAETILRSCPNVQILASSREALSISGEQIYRLSTLSLPRSPLHATPENLTQYEAVRLFIERAASVQSTFTVTNANAPALAELCVRLDGIPLALELAAARVRSLSVEEIGARLDSRFRLLTGGSRTALPRQQTLRASIDWSFDLLNDLEKTLLRRVSVFAGGWGLEAAEKICSDEVLEDWEILDGLASLVDKSLILYEEHEGGTRYRMLEVVRQYSQDKLAESGETDILRERHRHYFLELSEEAEKHLRGPEQQAWLERLETNHDNLRAALEWRGDETCLRMAGALGMFWGMRGHYSEGRRWLSDALTRSGGAIDPSVKAKALLRAGVLAYHQGDFPEARRLYEGSLALHRALGDERSVATLLGNLGIIAHDQGDYRKAQNLHQESLALRRKLGDTHGVTLALGNLALAASEQGDYETARRQYEEVLDIQRSLGDTHGIALSLNNLGIVAHIQGDIAAARTVYSESLTLQRQLGDRLGIAQSLYSLGNLAISERDYATAWELHQESLAIQQEIGNKSGIGASLSTLGNLALERGDRDASFAYLHECLSLCKELGDKRLAAYALEGFAEWSFRPNQTETAILLLGAAKALRDAIGAPLAPDEQNEHERILAEIHAVAGTELFDSAFSAGQELDWENAIDLALKTKLT